MLIYGYRRYSRPPVTQSPLTPRPARTSARSPAAAPAPPPPTAATSETILATSPTPLTTTTSPAVSSSTTKDSPLAVPPANPRVAPATPSNARSPTVSQSVVPSYSPAQAVAALLAETHEDVKRDTGIDLDSANTDVVSAHRQTRQQHSQPAESSWWDDAAEIARRLKEESKMDEKQPPIAYEPWRPPGPLPHKHHHATQARALHHTTTPSPLLTPPAAASPSADYVVESQPKAAAAAPLKPVAQPEASEPPQSTAVTDMAPSKASATPPAQPLQSTALVVQPNTYLVASPLRTIHPTPVLLSSPSLSPVILRPPVLPSTALVPPLAASSISLPSLSSASADPAWLYSAVASASSLLPPPALDTSTALITVSSPSAPSIGSAYYTTLPSYSTSFFNPLHPANQPILAFITDSSHMLAASTSSPTSSSLTSLTAAATSSASQVVAGSSEVSDLLSRSTLLVELLCVLVLFIGVLATAVDARYLVPLTPITFYVLYVCVQAVRANGGHTVLFPAALFAALMNPSHLVPSTSSSSSNTSNHHLLPRALFPVRRDMATLPPSAHLSPVSSSESMSSAASPSSARLHSPSSSPSVPRQSSDMDDTPLPPSSASFSLPAETLSPVALELSPSSVDKPAQSDDAALTPVGGGRRRERREGREEVAYEDEDEDVYEHKDDEVEHDVMDSPSRGKRVSFLNERRRGLVGGASSREVYDEQKGELSSPVHVSSARQPHLQSNSPSQPSRSMPTVSAETTKKDASFAADTTDDEELSSAASSTPPSPAQSASSTSSSTHSPIDRELSFFPPEPALDISGAMSSTLTVRFTYRHSVEECMQAYWDISQPDWEQTGHSLGLNTSRPAPPIPATPSASSSAGMPPSPSFRRESSAASAVDIEHAIVEWWHSTTSSSLFMRRQLNIHTKVPAVVKKAIGGTPIKRLTLDEHAQLDPDTRTFRLQCSNARYRKAILIHDTRTFTPHPEHPHEWSVLSCRFRLCVLPSCGLLKATVYGWVSGVWKAKQQEVGQRIGRRLERWREMRSMEERERARVEEVGGEVEDLGSGVSVEIGQSY